MGARSGSGDPDSTIYVCDLDGTLLRSDGTLSDFAKHGLNQLLGAGVRLTIASSRRTVAMRALLGGVRLRLPVVELNGAFVSELGSGRHLASNVLSAEVACAVVEAIGTTGADPVLSAWDGRNDWVHFGSRANEALRWYVAEKRAYGDPELAPCEDLLGVAGRQRIAAITAFVADPDAPEVTERVRALVGDSAVVYSARNYYCPGWTEIQVQHSAAEKGAALPTLLAACKADGARVVACGDHLNDLGLFGVADESIAPRNAHPEVLRRASMTVASNDEDGIVRYLLERHGRAYGEAT